MDISATFEEILSKLSWDIVAMSMGRMSKM